MNILIHSKDLFISYKKINAFEFQLFDRQKCLTKIVIAEIKICRKPTFRNSMSAFILRTPGKFLKEHGLHSEHGESLKTTKICRDQLSNMKALYCPFVVAALKQYDTLHIFSTLHNKPVLSAPHYLSAEGNVSNKTPAYLSDLKSTTYNVVPDLYNIKLTKHNEYN